MFDSSFLERRAKQVQKWKSKGIKTGSGRPFTDILVNEAVSKPLFSDNRAGGADDAFLPLSVSLVDPTNPIPGWLEHIVETDREVAAGLRKRSKVTPESPHKQALIAAVKKPELLKKYKEHYIQVRLFYWLEMERPEQYLYTKAVPNGGLRSKKTAFDMKAEGQKAGSPDIDIEMARGAYFGMKLEVKTESGTLQANQKERIELLRKAGFYVVVGKGFNECKSLLEGYFSLPPFDNMTRLD